MEEKAYKNTKSIFIRIKNSKLLYRRLSENKSEGPEKDRERDDRLCMDPSRLSYMYDYFQNYETKKSEYVVTKISTYELITRISQPPGHSYLIIY